MWSFPVYNNFKKKGRWQIFGGSYFGSFPLLRAVVLRLNSALSKVWWFLSVYLQRISHLRLHSFSPWKPQALGSKEEEGAYIFFNETSACGESSKCNTKKCICDDDIVEDLHYFLFWMQYLTWYQTRSIRRNRIKKFVNWFPPKFW